MRKLSRNPILALLVFCGAFLLLIQREWPSGMGFYVVWGLFLTMGAVAVYRMIRRRNFGPYGQPVAMPGPLRRWVLDEPDEDPNRPADHGQRR